MTQDDFTAILREHYATPEMVECVRRAEEFMKQLFVQAIADEGNRQWLDSLVTDEAGQ